MIHDGSLPALLNWEHEYEAIVILNHTLSASATHITRTPCVAGYNRAPDTYYTI